MMGSRVFFGFLLLLLLLLTTQDEYLVGNKMMMMKKVAEAAVCQRQSQDFRGPCLSDLNCLLVCRNEGCPSGRCRGFLTRQCYCNRPCP